MGKGKRNREARNANPTPQRLLPWEEVLRAWAVSMFHEASNDADVAAALKATILAVQAIGPDTRTTGISHCAHACEFVRYMLELEGFSPKIVTVQARISTSKMAVLDVIGDANPSLKGAEWSGHAVVIDTATGLLIDPTIGQARAATTTSRRYPLVRKIPDLLEMYQVGMVIGIRRESDYVITYAPVEAESPLLDVEVSAVRDAVDRVRVLLSE